MRTFLIFLGIVGLILATFWILRSAPPTAMRDVDRISSEAVQKAVEKALNEPDFIDATQGRIDKVVVTDVRASDDGKRFKVYLDYYLKDQMTEQSTDMLKRDEFGVWTLDKLSRAKLVLKENQ